jgi:hypothetical protein
MWERKTSFRSHLNKNTLLRLLILAMLTAVLGVSGFGTYTFQSGKSAGQEFVGDWQADFKGQPYWTVRIDSVKPNISGRFSTAQFNFDEHGNVYEVSGDNELRDFSPMLEPRIEGSRLIFRWTTLKTAGEWAMTVTGPDSAEIRMINLDDPEDNANLEHFKPFVFKRRK